MRFAVALSTVIVLTACTSTPPIPELPEPTSYDMNSWQTMIDPSCTSFFDGCNNCQRMPDGGAACTKKFCQTYEQPRCMDNE